jgi:hypothetical protein
MSHNKLLRTTLLNIDSSTRNINPKNIYLSNNKTLSADPLQFTQNSNIVKVNYMNHGLSIGDMIIVQNVVGISKTLVESFYLLNNFNYLVIIFPNNMIPTNYTNYVKSLFANISIYGTQTAPNIINNISINSFLGYQQIYLYNDLTISIDTSTQLNNMIATVASISLSSVTSQYINSNVLFIKLPISFNNISNFYTQINQIFNISYQHIAGVSLPNINANYPINNYNYQSYHQVSNIIDNNTFTIQLNIIPFSTINGGGSNVQVMKITNIIQGYPNSNSYTIDLKKSFNNVVNIELISTEFPYVDMTVKKNVNDKLYWSVIDDGPHVYSIQIDEGNYTSSTLISKLTTLLNATQRVTSTSIDLLYNNFTVQFDSKINTITFSNYVNLRLPNTLSINLVTINNLNYLMLSINDLNNVVMVGDSINISNASATTYTIQNDTNIYSVGAGYINNSFEVYSVDTNNNIYTVILGLTSQITTTTTTTQSRGGNDIIINKSIATSFLFNYSDTVGEIIGFNNVGSQYSITPFLNTITNKTPYVNMINLDAVGNITTYTNGFVNLAGKYDYILMYMNDIEYIYNTNSLQSAFAKIQLSGNPGDILFNTFIKQTDAYSKVFPILSLNQLNISYTYPDGSVVNFRNINHSFTLKIVEEIIQYDMIYLKSKDISVEAQMLKAKLDD